MLKILKLKNNKSLNIDDPQTTLLHKKIIQQKKFLKKLYIEWYFELRKLSKYNDLGKFVELGSGGGFIKEVMPNILTSDVLELPNCDLVFNCERMPFADNSIDGIIMIDVFHHIPNPSLFLIEARRVLKVNGTIVMSEPWNTSWSRFIYKNFHHEPFDIKGERFIESTGPLSGANGALPWIYFVRDQEKFKLEFPFYEITTLKLHTAFRYLLSGGVSYRQIVPLFSFPLWTFFENIIPSRYFSMFAYVKLIKKY